MSNFLANKRYLLFKVPKIGYLLFALSGGALPPFCQADIFAKSNQEQWERDGDVFAAVPAKSGTTWLMNTLHYIRFKGQPPPFRDIYEEVRWAEFVYYPAQPMRERIEILNQSAQNVPFAIYKSHYGPQTMQWRANARYITCVRHPVDLAASLFYFASSHTKPLAKMWGGFPPSAGEADPDMAEFERSFLVDMGNGKALFDEVALNCIAEFWPRRHSPNVLLVHYGDRVRDHVGEIQRMAQFLQCELTPTELDLVAEATSFQAMKRDADKYFGGYIFEPFRAQGKVAQNLKSVVTDMVNLGPSRNGQAMFRDEFVQAIRLHVERRFGPEVTEWIYQGGELPQAEM